MVRDRIAQYTDMMGVILHPLPLMGGKINPYSVCFSTLLQKRKKKIFPHTPFIKKKEKTATQRNARKRAGAREEWHKRKDLKKKTGKE